MKRLLSMFFISFFLISCIVDKSEPERIIPPAKDFTEIDKAIIMKYLEENKIEAKMTTSGLFYEIRTQGEGGQVTLQNPLEIFYKGYFVDGEVFDESKGDGTLFEDPSNLIPGFKEGLLLMNEGGEATFFIPSNLGYGNSRRGSIPANSVLIFDIKVLSIN